jgi:hypothetical protein
LILKNQMAIRHRHASDTDPHALRLLILCFRIRERLGRRAAEKAYHGHGRLLRSRHHLPCRRAAAQRWLVTS